MTGQQPVALPPPPAKIHFIGIGGIGMSGLARILRSWGYQVSGSDATASELTDKLMSEGIPVSIGHDDTTEVERAEFVVATAAVRPDNPEVIAARAANRPLVKRAELLGMLANERHTVAVAGSHGKSTTSGMLVAALRALGDDPSYAIGAVLGLTGTNAAAGGGRAMVVEADEYDYSFLHLTPDIAIVTNIEYDHPDLFPDQPAYDLAFARFAANLRPGGTLVLAADDPGCTRLRARLTDPGSIVTFGAAGNPDWLLTPAGTDWNLIGPGGTTVHLTLQVPGEHNARNAAAALAALVALGHDPERAAMALATFTGVGRRFELKGEAAGVTVIDDYSHHPTEIRAALQAARERFPSRRVWAVFQPHTYSRTHVLLDDFAAAFTDADQVMILAIYAARETDSLGVDAQQLVDRLPPGSVLAQSPHDAAIQLVALTQPGDVVLTIGAGTITATGALLLGLLAESTPGPSPVIR